MSPSRAGIGVRRALPGVLFVGDLVLAGLALCLAFEIRLHLRLPLTQALLPADRMPIVAAVLPVVLPVQALLLYFFGLYDREPLPRSELLRRLLSALTLLGCALVAWHYFFDRALPRSVLLAFIGLDGVVLFAWRFALQRLPRIQDRRVAIVGSGAPAREIAAGIVERQWHGLRVAGWVPAPGEDDVSAAAAVLGPRLGDIQDLPALLARDVIDDIILAPTPVTWQTALVDRLASQRPGDASVLLLPGPFDSLIGQLRYRWVHDIPLIEVVRQSDWQRRRPAKRVLDLLGAVLLLVLAAPLMLAAAVWIRIRAGRGVLYRQIRVGRAQHQFTLIKFRTMRNDAEPQGEVLAQPGDARFIPGGALLRRLRIDELPQLWNVLAGHMSLVGPRPERPGFVARYLSEVPGYAERFLVAPGVTGLAQVNGDYYSSAANKLRYDLAYIANCTIWLDLSILFRTIKIVLTSRGV